MKLKIGAHIFTVKYVPDTELESDYGECCYLTNTIKINSELPKTQKVVTLLHEVLHQINTKLEEEQVDFLAQGIGQVLLDNSLLKLERVL